MSSKASGHTNPNQLAEELRALELPYLASAKRVVAGPTELSQLTWETRQACFLALLAEVPEAQTAEALSALVHKRRQGRKAERALEKSGRVEDLGLLPEYCRQEEDAFREDFMVAVVEEMQRQQAPKGLCNVRLLLKDKALCLQAISFLAARHRSRAGLEHRVSSSNRSSSISRLATSLHHRSPLPMVPTRAVAGQTDAAEKVLQFTPTRLSSNGRSSNITCGSSSTTSGRTYLPSAHKTPFLPSSTPRPSRADTNRSISSIDTGSSSRSSSKKASRSTNINGSDKAGKGTTTLYRIKNTSELLARGLGRLNLEGEEEEEGMMERQSARVMPGGGSRMKKTQDDKEEEELGNEEGKEEWEEGSDSDALSSGATRSSSEEATEPEVRRPAHRALRWASEDVEKGQKGEEDEGEKEERRRGHAHHRRPSPSPRVKPHSSTTSLIPASRNSKLPPTQTQIALPPLPAATATAAERAASNPKPSWSRPKNISRTSKAAVATKSTEGRRPSSVSSNSSSNSNSNSNSRLKNLNPTPPSLPRTLPILQHKPKPPPPPPPPPADGAMESELEQQLRANNAALRLALSEHTSLQEALLLNHPSFSPSSSSRSTSVDERCLRLLEHQNLQLQRQVQQLKSLLQGEQEAADGLTHLLSALEQRVTALMEGTEGREGREGWRGTPGGRRRSSPGEIGREEWLQGSLQELHQLQQQWRSVRRATRVSQGVQRLFLPADALIYLKKPREGRHAEGEEEGKEEAVMGLNGEWEDRARIWGVRGGSEGEREGGMGAMLCELDGDKVHALQRDLRSLVGGLGRLLSKEGGREAWEHTLEQARALALAVAHLGVVLPATSSSSCSSSLPVRPLTRERELLEGFDSLLVPRLKPSELQRRVQKLQQMVLGERRGLLWGINNAMGNVGEENEEEEEEEEEEEDEEDEEEEVVVGRYEYAATAGLRPSPLTSRGRRVVGEQR